MGHVHPLYMAQFNNTGTFCRIHIVGDHTTPYTNYTHLPHDWVPARVLVRHARYRLLPSGEGHTSIGPSTPLSLTPCSMHAVAAPCSRRCRRSKAVTRMHITRRPCPRDASCPRQASAYMRDCVVQHWGCGVPFEGCPFRPRERYLFYYWCWDAGTARAV